ncbi:MAG TPA: pitrilysin family protein [Vicinamibacterales bacterium]|nr:pitrilysin family protein [Vicinamibacterales bacterium]
MTRRLTLVVALGAIVLIGADRSALVAQSAAAPARASATTPPISEFDVRGMTVLVKQRPGSETVAAGLFIRGGAQNITAANAGIESLMLNVATEASVAFPRDRFRRELASTGTTIGSGVTLDFSALTLGCARTYFDRAWALFADAALHPSFTSDDFAQVQNHMIVGLQSADDTADALLSRLTDEVVYAGHPYASDPEGTLETIRRLTVADVRQFHQRVMETSRLMLVVVGDVTPEDVRAKVTASFAKLPRGTYKATAVPQLAFAAPTLHVTAKDLPTHYVNGIYAAPPPDSPDIDAMRVATSILRDRVFDQVRLRRALSYAPNAFLNDQRANTGGIYVTAVDANAAVRVMLGEITRLQTEPVDPGEIESVAAQFLTNYYVDQQTNAAQTGTLARAEMLGGGWQRSTSLIERINAVSPFDVRRAAARYMRHIQFIVLGPDDDIERPIFLQEPGPAGPTTLNLLLPTPRMAAR